MAAAQTWYFTGKPCKRGHISTRNVASFECHQCHREDKLVAMNNGPRKFDLVGKVFSHLTVVEHAANDNGKIWRCRCDCGGEALVRTGHLRSGSAKSCGCLARETARRISVEYAHKRVKHGMSCHRLDGIFDNMISRCEDSGNERWPRYGGRGIRICAEWRTDRSKFFAWALANGYADDLTIDRIDNDGDYEPSNCRFVDGYIQQNNTSRNRVITVGLVSRTMANWARFLDVSYSAIQHRVERGWSPERIIGQPFRRSPSKGSA